MPLSKEQIDRAESIRRVESLAFALEDPRFADQPVTRKQAAQWIRDALAGKIDAETPEPEYEYALRGKKWTLPSDARFDSLQEVQEWLPRYTRKPEDWVIVRRRSAGEWEDVK